MMAELLFIQMLWEGSRWMTFELSLEGKERGSHEDGYLGELCSRDKETSKAKALSLGYVLYLKKTKEIITSEDDLE